MRRLIAVAVAIGSSLIAAAPVNAFWWLFGEKSADYSRITIDKWTNKPVVHSVELNARESDDWARKIKLRCYLETGTLRLLLGSMWSTPGDTQVMIAFDNSKPVIEYWSVYRGSGDIINPEKIVDASLLNSLLGASNLKVEWSGSFNEYDLEPYRKVLTFLPVALC